ncbi:MAG: hypothetical protein RL693_306, partial [Verrucomicrobiota bacterium]
MGEAEEAVAFAAQSGLHRAGEEAAIKDHQHRGGAAVNLDDRFLLGIKRWTLRDESPFHQGPAHKICELRLKALGMSNPQIEVPFH